MSKYLVLDVSAFERLLGPCMDIMKSRMPEYEEQLAIAFGSKVPWSTFHKFQCKYVKKLSSYQKFRFFNPYIFASQCHRTLIFQTRSKNLSLKFKSFIPSGCKDIGIRVSFQNSIPSYIGFSRKNWGSKILSLTGVA